MNLKRLMKRRSPQIKSQLLLRYGLLASLTLTVLCLGFSGFVWLRLTIAASQAPFPQGILTLGGSKDREQVTAEFVRLDPSLKVWISRGQSIKESRKIFQAAGAPLARVHFDRRAEDTVTNFTSVVKDLKNRQIAHIYIITSDFHMPRAKAIATIVLGSHGITFTPVSVPSHQPPEPWLSILRDSGRAIFWLVTGHTGASLNSRF